MQAEPRLASTGAVAVVVLVALQDPIWRLGVGAVLIALMMYAVIRGRGSHAGAPARAPDERPQREAIRDLDRAALDITVNNASLISAFTRVVSLSEQQREALRTIGNSVDALSGSVREMTESAGVAFNEAQRTHTLATRGAGLVGAAGEGIEAVAHTVEKLEHHFREVVARVDEIGGVVRIIHDVAGQTNLLALNAAIEAARAGEQGRGFAVVADEVRKLAERTSQATVEIGRMIAAIRESTGMAESFLERVADEVRDSVTKAGEAGGALGEITDCAQRTLDVAGELATAAQMQAELGATIVEGMTGGVELSNQSEVAVRTCNENVRKVQDLIVDLKHRAALIDRDRADLDVILDSIEEMRANNILVMNSSTVEEARPALARIDRLDAEITAAFQRFTAEGVSSAGAAVETFARALQAYRTARIDALAGALKGDFAHVRERVPARVRPAYDAVRTALLQLREAQGMA